MTFWENWEDHRVMLRPSSSQWYNPRSIVWIDEDSGASGEFPVAPVIPDYEDFNDCSGVSLGQVLEVTSSTSSDGSLTFFITFVGRVFETYDERIFSLDEGNWPVSTVVSQYYRETPCLGLKFPETFHLDLSAGCLVYESAGFRYWWGGGKRLPGQSLEWWRVRNHNSDYYGWFPCINDFLSALPLDPPRIPEDYPYSLYTVNRAYGLADISFKFRATPSPAAIIPALRSFGWGFGWGGGGLALSPFRGLSARLDVVDSFVDNYRSNYD